jgi:hypothetical protein
MVPNHSTLWINTNLYEIYKSDKLLSGLAHSEMHQQPKPESLFVGSYILESNP